MQKALAKETDTEERLYKPDDQFYPLDLYRKNLPDQSIRRATIMRASSP